MFEETHPLVILQAHAQLRPFTTWFTIVSIDDRMLAEGETTRIPVGDLRYEYS